jgi:predicted permease
MVVAQVAGSLMLLIVAGLCIRSLRQSAGLDLGFDPDHVLNLTVDPHQIGYDRTRTLEFYRQLKERVGGLAGVESVTEAYGVPLGTIVQVSGGNVSIENHPIQPGEQPPLLFFNAIGTSYFQTMRVPLLRGRDFTDFDNEKAPPVAIINQAMAEKYWPREDPLGKRFTLKTARDASAKTLQVVGVCRNGKYIFISEGPQPFFYSPLAQNYFSLRTLQIRSSVPPETLLIPAQGEIRKLAPDLPIIEANTMKQNVDGYNGLQVFRLGAGASAGMGLVGLILAMLGVYGVVSFSAVQRTKEIGIRMALGGTSRDVLGLVLRQGLWLLIAGLVVGLLMTLGISRVMARVLVGVSPSDPLTYVSVVVLLSAIALLACYIPARRAMRVDPMVALRHE